MTAKEPLMAQNVHFSQFHLAPVQTNPASIATSNQTQIIFNYRNQSIGAGQAYQTPMVSLIYPWIKKRRIRKAAFGLSFLQDKTGEGGILNTTGGLATLAYNFSLSSQGEVDTLRRYRPFLSLGAQAGYYQRQVNADALTTGSLWNGSNVDPSLPIGEPLEMLNARETFAVVHAGALFYLADNCGETKAYFGVNVQNVNQPESDFFNQASPIPLYYIMSGGINFNVSPYITLQPNVRWVQEKNTREIRTGALAYYNFFGTGSLFGEGKVGAGLWYDTNSALVLGIEVHQPKYFIGFSYDMGASSPVRTLGNTSWELTLGIKLGRRCLEQEAPKEYH
ncbi:MAG: PorP/SprF family type IX secretion system membrane protein [Bacteroidia bacterium]|nr:PorP/SprF family type IX secretion system membrane protein [Bacteroidia bacterium]